MRTLTAWILAALLLASPASAQIVLPSGGSSGGGGSGTVTEVDTGTGLSGGPITTTGTVACAQASNAAFGCVETDNTTITATAGVISAVYNGTVTSVATDCQATGGTITTTGAISTQETISSQTGSNYPFVTGNCGQLVNLNNAGAQTPTIPVAGSAGFPAGWYVDVCNIGAGAQTLTPATGTVGGAATRVFAAGSASAPVCARLISDGVSNYVVVFPPGSGATGAAGGDLTGTYPNPTVKASVGLTGTPTSPTASAGDNTTQIATDAFVTTAVANAIAGVNPAIAVKVATTAAGDTSGLTYANGASGIGATFTGPNNTAITIDGVTFTAVGQRLLVKNDTQSPSGAFNGVYALTALQTGITGAIFTRALDYDAPSDINNTGSIPVVSGTVNATTSWLLTSSVTTVGTDPLTYTQFSINPAKGIALATGSSTGNTLTAPAGYFICTSTCTVTPPVPAAGYRFCVMNDDNVNTVITLGAIGSSSFYEKTARNGYGTAGTGTFVSGGAIGDMICILGRDSTHYLTPTFVGAWTAS